MKYLLAVIACLALAAPASAHGLFVFGDSLAIGTERYLPDELPGWQIKQDNDYTRSARRAAPALRARGERLPAVIHLSLGTVDDPHRTGRFRRWVRRAMRAAGPDRCVVWANIARPHRAKRNGKPDYSLWGRLNRVLDAEAARRDNLVIVDWLAMAKRHPGWMSPVDATHVNRAGNRARAHAVARAVRHCP